MAKIGELWHKISGYDGSLNVFSVFLSCDKMFICHAMVSIFDEKLTVATHLIISRLKYPTKMTTTKIPSFSRAD